MSPTPQLCLWFNSGPHHQCCLFAQLTHCCLMFRRSTIGLLKLPLHSTAWLGPSFLWCAVKVSCHDGSCQSLKWVKKHQRDKVKKWWHYLSPAALIPPSEASGDKPSDVLNQKHIGVCFDPSHDHYLRGLVRCQMQSVQIPGWAAALSLWACRSPFLFVFNRVRHCWVDAVKVQG